MVSPLAILLVEDEPLVAQGQRNKLRARGAHVTLAETFAAAQEQIRERVWDGIVLDVGLPGGSGIDLLKEIRATQAVTPVLVESALPDRSLPNDAHLYDAYFVAKPFEDEHLDRLMERVRDRKDQRNALLSEAVAHFVHAHEVTEVEAELLRWALQGKSHSEIAELRDISHNTLKSQVRRLLKKTGARNLAHLSSVVFAQALVDSGDAPVTTGTVARGKPVR